ncbi:Uncharacterized metal-dependent hydrolase BUsg_343 [Candidatus Xenohaliotis californiensis]|uniref:Uncharacterized metal-dependent hydrolase BUsg_343 n=1 Tax=Candidatus Xenohaliotis californiensis TaxID=84677 RepID=A0ABM9N8Z7_9RICK|nr:Uncharacterized metal-dependent hydrolase BUsg_343 [Candidatus Xenohaliotis californiensis]
MLVDSHCHLDYEPLDSITSLIKRAKESGVHVMQTICTKKTGVSNIIKIIETHKEVFGSVGTHPLEIEKGEAMTCSEIIDIANHSKIIGIGETGLDYHYSKTNHEIQKKVFLEHIRASSITKLPIIIHSRDADIDMIEILKRELVKNPFTGVMHCFTSSAELALQAIEAGLYISFSGIITFKNTEQLHHTIKLLPLDKILIETDSPYLTPIPFRGKKNEPANLKYTALKMAEIINISFDELSKITTENFYKLFNKTKNNN